MTAFRCYLMNQSYDTLINKDSSLPSNSSACKQESVLDAKLQNKELVPPSSGSETASLEGIGYVPSDSISNLSQQRVNLQEAILKYEDIVDNLEKHWQLKVSLKQLHCKILSILKYLKFTRPTSPQKEKAQRLHIRSIRNSHFGPRFRKSYYLW